MISSFQLKFRRVPGAVGERVGATPVTVFVGPNNSGKSRVLAEIERYCRSGEKDAGAVILDELSFAGLDASHAERAIDRIRQPPNPGEAVSIDHLFVGSRYGRQQVPLAGITQFLQRPTDNNSRLLPMVPDSQHTHP